MLVKNSKLLEFVVTEKRNQRFGGPSIRCKITLKFLSAEYSDKTHV